MTMAPWLTLSGTTAAQLAQAHTTVGLFRALHLDAVVCSAPYDPAQLAAVAAGVRPSGPL